MVTILVLANRALLILALDTLASSKPPRHSTVRVPRSPTLQCDSLGALTPSCFLKAVWDKAIVLGKYLTNFCRNGLW